MVGILEAQSQVKGWWFDKLGAHVVHDVLLNGRYHLVWSETTENNDTLERRHVLPPLAR